MSVTPLKFESPAALQASLPTLPALGGRSFELAMGEAGKNDRFDEARNATRQSVASTFVMPTLPELGARSFEQWMREAGKGDRFDEAGKAARQLVASTFIMPVLSTMREARFATGPFAPGDAERRFGPMLDQKLADRIMSGTDFRLIDSVQKQILANEASAFELSELRTGDAVNDVA